MNPEPSAKKQQGGHTRRHILPALILLLIMACLTVPARAGAGRKKLRINEVQAGNHLTLIDGVVCDWIELYNGGESAVDLAGWGLSDAAALPYKAVLSGTLAPGAFMTLKASDEGLGFALAREGERITLTAPDGRITDEFSYEQLPWDACMAWDGQRWQETWRPTPGEENLVVTRDEAETSRYLSARARGIYISEVMAANGDYTPPRPSCDWLELHNPTDRTVELSGLYLSSGADDLKRWAFPPGAALSAYGRAAVYCTDDTVPAGNEGIYVNDAFKLDKSDGALILSDGENIIDCVSLGEQFGNVAYGRPEGQGAFRYLYKSTFLEENPAEGFEERVEAPAFSRGGGFVSAPFMLSLSAPGESKVRYTLDGSEPGDDSPLYREPLAITGNSVVRAIARREGFIDSPLATHTYLFEQAPPCPVVCLSGDESVFYGAGGLFEKRNFSSLAQYRINVEIYEYDAARVNQQAGLKLTGHTSRVLLPRTFSLYARPGLGEGTFQYNPFPDRSYSAYASFTLRSGGTDAMKARLRDGFLGRLASGYSLMYLACAPAAVYVNAQYWGELNLRERANQDAVAQWEGINDKELIDDILIIKNGGVRQQGSRDELEELAAYCKMYNLNFPMHYEYVAARLDIDSLFAHAAIEIITGNSDMSNIRFYRVPGGKWKLLLYDLDLAMKSVSSEPLDYYLGKKSNTAGSYYVELFTSLMQVREVRVRFFTLTGRILLERFTRDKLTAELDAWQAAYAPLMQRHFERWPDRSFAEWEQEMADFRGMLMKRPALVVQHLSRAYHLSQVESARFFGAFTDENNEQGSP